MSLFDRIPRPGRPRYDNKLLSTPETKDDPVTPIPETEPATLLVQKCAACGEREATHPLKIGWFYIGRLPFVGLCDICYEIAEKNELHHHMAQKKTVMEHAAVKPRRTRLTRIEEGRTPSRPLEDRVHNLATGA